METTEKFTGKADVYEKYRPEYPEAFLDDLIARNGLTAADTVADIGAGTGKLTRQLARRGLTVAAVEPNDDMRAAAERALAGFSSVTLHKGTAEHTGLAEGSAALVTAAQAFHWFDVEGFKAECKRILKPDCPAVLVWNSRDPESDLIVESEIICQRLCPLFNGFSGGIEESTDAYNRFFRDGQYEKKTFRNDIYYDLDGFIGRHLSASYAPKQGENNYQKFNDSIKQLFVKYSSGGKVLMPSITRSYIGLV